MAADEFSILSGEFQLLGRPLGPGWVMRISGRAQNLLHRALPFVARVGEQPVEVLSFNFEGDRYEGFLRRVPNVGDRLFVGYDAPTVETAITFKGGVGPPVA
jgi:hypothetical protein